MGYKIIVDSCCDLTEDMHNWDNLQVIPLTLELGDYSILDDANFDQEDFIARMTAYAGTARSACPSPEAFKHAMEGSATDVYIITITSKLSGSYNSAVQGKALYEEEHGQDKNIHIFNSLATSGIETIAAHEIKRLADGGADFETVKAQVEDLIQNRTALYFCLESLDALKNNGRLFTLAASVLQKLRVKLICHRTPEGSIGLSGQDFALNRAITKMCDMVSKDVEGKDLRDKTLIIGFVCCPERAQTVAKKITDKSPFGRVEILKCSGLNSLYASKGGIIVSYNK